MPDRTPNRPPNHHDLRLPPPRADPAAIALFLDLDGTLLDFASRPDAVVVEPSLRATLRQLHHALDGALAVLSGRPIRGIDALLGLDGIAAAGLHGSELRHADGRLDVPAITPRHLDRLRRQAHRLADEWPGILVEDKDIALALHWRNAPLAEQTLRQLADILLRDAGPAFELQYGQCVIEIKPAGSDKGRALATLMGEPPFAGRRPWMLGDDLTDEHAFASAEALDGLGIIVGPRRPTTARRALPDAASARAWLAAITADGKEFP